MNFQKKVLPCAILSAVTAPLTAPLTALGQEPAAVLEEVVVTGTLIRGVEVTGSQPISLDTEAVATSGAVNTNELLATVPQVSNFFNARPEQDPRGASQTIVSRPNLRNLPGFNSASGTTTLVLVDGHRLTPVGIDQASLDPDLIPGSVIERVEIVMDGGSSLYGADAVGGVINFITRKEFEGVEVDINYGVGDDYDTAELALTGGTSFDGGSVLFSISHSERDGVQNADRDWARRGTWTEDGLVPDDTECINPVGAISTWFFYGAGWTDNPRAPGTGVTPVGTPCAAKDQESLLPEQDRDNLWASIRYELTDNIEFQMSAYYGEQTSYYSRYPLGDTISGELPGDLGLGAEDGYAVGDLYDVQSLGFSYGAHPSYNNREMEISYDTWGFSPEFTLNLKNDWQLRQTFHYGRSKTTLIDPSSNRPTMLALYDNGMGPFDPADIANVDAAVINNILNFENAAETVQELFLARLVADGALMELPAGFLRMAAGVEFSQDQARKRQGQTEIGGLGDLKSRQYSRDITSVYAELQIPVLDSLDLSLSLRQDDYSDFGDTTNPTIGFDFEPVDWLRVYAHWGESFNAPTAVDGLGQATIRNLTFGTASVVPDPNNERDPARENVLQITGLTGGTLLPQTAETWAAGLEFAPLEGLVFGATYYEIDFNDILGAPNPQLVSAVLTNPDKFIFNPTQAEVDAFLAIVDNAEQYPDIDVDGLGIIVDRRTSNTDSALVEGMDFYLNYTHDTDLGTFAYGINGNKVLTFDIQSSGGPVVDNLDEGVSDLNVSGNVTWRRDNWHARATVKYSNGFDTSTAFNQDEVDEFVVTDLFIGYEFDADSGLTEGLSLRLNVDNVFDEDPPLWRQSGNFLPYSGFTLGRVFKFGVTKTF